MGNMLKVLGMLAVLAAASPAALAATAVHGGDASPRRAASAPARQVVAGEDPLADVYLVTSRDTYLHALQGIVRRPGNVRDGAGRSLVVSTVKAGWLPRVSEAIHRDEQRCGGFFAFANRAEAEAFVRNDRTAQAVLTRPLAAYTIDNQATVSPWLNQVSAANIKSTIATLSAFRNRYYASSYGKAAAEGIRDAWQALAAGRDDANAALFTGCNSCSTQPSVIMTVQGAELPDEIVVLGAHLDSINGSGGGSTEQVAPGADDDASGIATLTEAMRIALASGWKPRRTVMFMGYAAEEVGLRGSNAIAQAFAGQGRNVVGVLQLDMTNYKLGGGPDMRIITDYSNAAMKQFLLDLFDEYLAPLGLTRGSYTCGYGCSDHASWTSAGYPSAMMFEAGDPSGEYFPYIHSSSDTLANMNDSAANSAKFAKLALAFVGELGKTAQDGPPPANEPPVASFDVSANGLLVQFTDTSSDSDGTIASRHWNFGDGATSNVANPSHAYAAAGTYTVTETVVDDDGANDSASLQLSVAGSGSGGDTDGGVLANGAVVVGISKSDGSITYRLDVPAHAVYVAFLSEAGSGNAEMYVKRGAVPGPGDSQCASERTGNTERCVLVFPRAGSYYVKLVAAPSFQGLSLRAAYRVF